MGIQLPILLVMLIKLANTQKLHTREPDTQQMIKAINYLFVIMQIFILNNLEVFLYYICVYICKHTHTLFVLQCVCIHFHCFDRLIKRLNRDNRYDYPMKGQQYSILVMIVIIKDLQVMYQVRVQGNSGAKSYKMLRDCSTISPRLK